MNYFGNSGPSASTPGRSRTAAMIPAFAGVAAIVLTYVVASGGTSKWSITAGAVIGLLYLAVYFAFYPRREESRVDRTGSQESQVQDRDELEDRLVALDEANEVFGSALNAADMFRLVSSRVNEIFPFAAAALAVPSESGDELIFTHFDGDNSELMRNVEIGGSEGLAGSAYKSGRIEIDNTLAKDVASIGRERLLGFVSSAAIPLIHTDEAFGVFQVFSRERIMRDEDTMKLLEGIAEHVTPIFRSSLAFERSLSSALTDALTGLPNERAFYMVLENQLAESMRHRGERPLTVLSIDIRDFGAVNSMLGHSIGDRMLEFTGARIGEHLRKMDFLARTVNDEFSIILPTASEEVAFEIIERIRAGFAYNEFEIADGEGVVVALNVGWATFWKDGETAEQLIRAAQQRKRQAKSEGPAGVLWFPKEYVN